YHQKQQRQERRRQFSAFVFGGVAAALIVTVSSFFYVSHYVHSHGTKHGDVAATLGVTTTLANTPQASEAPVSTSDIEAYKVDPDKPRMLRIPKLQLVARILPVAASFN